MRGNFQTLSGFVQEVEAIERRKKDYIVSEMLMYEDEKLKFGDRSYEINSHAHGQIAEKLGIPKAYYDRMTEIPGLRSRNVNAWLDAKRKPRMIRTLDDRVRAVLSNRYRAFDNYFVMSALLPALDDAVSKGTEIRFRAQGMTDARLYVQVTFPGMAQEVRVGDVVEAGLTITNSEIGVGRLNVEQLIYRLVCMNGMRAGGLVNRNHVGRAIGDREEDYSLYRDDTIAAELESYRLRIRDLIAHALSEEELDKLVRPLKAAAEQPFSRPTPVVENVTKRFGLTEVESLLALENLIEDHDYTQYGLANSITKLAHSLESLDRQFEVEGIGGQIINLSKADWEVIAA